MRGRHNARSVESAECGRFVIRSESRLNDLLLSLIEKINTPVLADASLLTKMLRKHLCVKLYVFW